MNIVHMSLEILVITNLMLPKSALPNVNLAFFISPYLNSRLA